MNGELPGIPAPDARDLAERAAEADFDESKWPAQLVEFLQVLEAMHRRKGLAADAAFANARDVVLALATHLGGRQFYLPRGDRLAIALRDAEIWHRFDGRNVAELAAQHGLTEIHLYAVLRRQRDLHRQRHQSRLPFDLDPQSNP